MKSIHPVVVIILGILSASIGFNILLWQSNRYLVYRIQKLEAGPARGLFDKSEQNNQPINDEELNKIITELLEQMKQEQARNKVA